MDKKLTPEQVVKNVEDETYVNRFTIDIDGERVRVVRWKHIRAILDDIRFELNENTAEELELPYKREVPCYWCELENENKGIDLPPFNNAICVAKEPFEGKYACLAHGDLLLISGWYGELLPDKEKTLCPNCGKVE